MDDKQVYTATERPKKLLQAVDNGDETLIHYDNLAQDALDMRRLGKKQEFKVRKERKSREREREREGKKS